MKRTLSFVLLLAIVSCGKSALDNSTATSAQALSSQKTLQIPSNLKADFDLMNQELVVYPKLPAIDNLIIEFTTDETLAYENEAKGICIKGNSTPKILLYRRDWFGDEGIGSPRLPATYFQQTASIFHLIGHCVFNLPHNDSTHQLPNGTGPVFNAPDSYMNSNFKIGSFGQWQEQAPQLMVGLKGEFYNSLVPNSFH